MKEGFGNRIQGKVEKRIERITDKMAGRFKDIQPFDTERVSPEQQLYDYEMMPPEQKMGIIRDYGLDTFLKFRDDMEKLRRQR